MRFSRVALALVTAVFAIWPSAVGAQLRQQESLDEPRYVGWVFTPSFATGGTWDDNLLLLHPDDVPIQDYATPINPSLLLEYRGRHTTLSSSYASSFLVYRDVSELNSSQQAVFARLQHRATPRVSIFVEESFTQAPTTDAVTFGGIPFQHIGTRTNAAGAGVEATVARNTVLRIAYTSNLVAFEADDRADDQDDQVVSPLQGGHSYEGSFSLSRALSRRFTFGGRYELRQAVVGGGEDKFSIQSGALTGDYKLTQMTTVSGFLGAARLGAGLHHSARIGPAIGVTLSRRTRLAAVSAGYQRTFIPSWAFGGTSQNEEWLASVQVPFARNRAYVLTRASLLDADSLDPQQPSLRSVWLGATLGYRATRWLNLEMFYGGSGQDSNQPGGDRRRNVFGFRIVTAKPMKLG